MAPASAASLPAQALLLSQRQWPALLPPCFFSAGKEGQGLESDPMQLVRTSSQAPLLVASQHRQPELPSESTVGGEQVGLPPTRAAQHLLCLLSQLLDGLCKVVPPTPSGSHLRGNCGGSWELTRPVPRPLASGDTHTSIQAK